MGKNKKLTVILAISLVLMLVSCIFTSMIQTNFGKVEVKEINWVTENGYTMNAWVFIPENATKDTPAPAVVTSHGMFNNKGMQDLNFVELARRGFVVLAQDMPSHGDSGDTDENYMGTFFGLYESVKVLAKMPFVDSTRIGITGHSLGGMSCNYSTIYKDNYAPTPLIAAILLNCADAEYTADGQFANLYGARDFGIVAAQYDEWFFDDTDANGNPTLPKDFIYNKNAQSILYFGQDPAGKPLREANTMYTETVDGQEAIRVIYTPEIIHPWSHFSYKSTVGTIEFFDAALDAPISIAPTNQVWQWKVVSNTIGLIGFFIFMVTFALVLAKTSFFSMSVEEPVAPRATTKGGKVWFFAATAIAVAFATLTYFPILGKLASSSGYAPAIPGTRQSSPMGVSMWAAACGLFAIVSMLVSYFCYGKKNGVDLGAVGLKISLKNLGKTILLAGIVVSSMLLILGVADYLFMADFRIWVVAFRAFKVEQLGITFAPYAFLFMVYFVANSVSVNCFNYNDIGGKKKWVNIALLAVAAGLPAVILLLMQYIPYFSGSDLMWPHNNMYGVWLFPMLVTLPGSAVVSRIIYKKTNNPYLGGIICAIIVAIMSCTNTLTIPG